jgi:hypothetical protein
MEDRSSQERLERLEREVATLRRGAYRGIRRRSSLEFAGLPLYDVALGPDPEKGEFRGHARGILAIGDMATGVIAVGGLARGIVALGGLAVGLLALGGLSIGLLLALGGAAIGGVAIGGGAVGGVAVGGGAAGYYACGGGVYGHAVVGAVQRDQEAVEFFRTHAPAGVCDVVQR